MSEEPYNDEAPITIDPESADSLVADEGIYTNTEHDAIVFSLQDRKFDTVRGEVSYWDLTVMFKIEGTNMFAHTVPFGEFNTRSEKFQQSKWPEFAGNLGLAGKLPSEAEGLPVTVTVGIQQFVRKADKLSQEELDAGHSPKQTRRNFIKNVVLE